MSCFVLHERATATLAETIAQILNMGIGYFAFEAPESLREGLADCIDRYDYCDGRKVYKKLYRLNFDAYNGRYRELEEVAAIPNFKPVELAERIDYNGHYIIQPWHYRFAKLLDCYIYQCLEDFTRNDPVVKGLTDLANRLRSFIVQNSEDYHKAPWGEI